MMTNTNNMIIVLGAFAALTLILAALHNTSWALKDGINRLIVVAQLKATNANERALANADQTVDLVTGHLKDVCLKSPSTNGC